MSPAPCETCGFDAAEWSERDLRTAPRWLRTMHDQMVERVPEPALALDGVARASAAVLDGASRAVVDERGDADVVHAALHHLRDLGRALHDAGAGAPTQTGAVAQVSTSDGGVPKSAVPSADVGRRGLLGDRQGNRTHHGRPFQALCLWSAEVIDALRAEGHPVVAGATGENVTLSGIDWASLRPGVRLLVGEVLCELSAWAEPCRKNDQWFTDRSDRIDHAVHPGWSRVYAWVLEPGTIAIGDEVVVEP